MQLLGEIVILGGIPGHREMGTRHLAHRGRQDAGTQRLQSVVGRRVRSVAGQRDVHHQHTGGPAAGGVGGHRLADRAASRRAPLQRGDRGLHTRAGDIGAGHDHLGRSGRLREGALDVVGGLHDGQVLRGVDGRLPQPHAERRGGQGEQRDGRDAAPDRRVPDHAADQRGPQLRWAGRGAPAAEEGDLAPIGSGAQPGQQRGQHGERAGDRDADHRDRAQCDAGELADAGQEQARHSDHHGDARHQDRAAGGAGGDPQRFGEGRAPGAFLALAAQVEQRVVDADCHPDDQHDLGGGGSDREPVAGDGDEGEGGHDGRDGEQHRDAGRHQGAEHHQEQDQRDGHRGGLGPAEVQ